MVLDFEHCHLRCMLQSNRRFQTGAPQDLTLSIASPMSQDTMTREYGPGFTLPRLGGLWGSLGFIGLRVQGL